MLSTKPAGQQARKAALWQCPAGGGWHPLANVPALQALLRTHRDHRLLVGCCVPINHQLQAARARQGFQGKECGVDAPFRACHAILQLRHQTPQQHIDACAHCAAVGPTSRKL